VGWTSLLNARIAAHFNGNTRSGRGRVVLGHALGEFENARVASHRSLLYEDALPVVPQLIEQDPVHSAVPVRDGRPFSRSPNSVINTKGRTFRRETTMLNDLWAAFVDEPMAQLHGCATRFLTLRGSA
jgi:hypothetical protein